MDSVVVKWSLVVRSRMVLREGGRSLKLYKGEHLIIRRFTGITTGNKGGGKEEEEEEGKE